MLKGITVWGCIEEALGKKKKGIIWQASGVKYSEPKTYWWRFTFANTEDAKRVAEHARGKGYSASMNDSKNQLSVTFERKEYCGS